VPAFAPRLLLGRDLADNLLFEGQQVLPRVLTTSGYGFTHPTLGPALTALLAR
jgi:NAD dependent epimerase/dehydratase family enzyme